MYVGSIVHPNQGVPILIDALPAGLRRLAPTPVACWSAARPRPASATGRSSAPHGDRLIVLTGQTPEQVVALTRRADVLVHPRLACRENYSVQSKIAVYLAAGRPIVATDFGDYTHDPGRDRRGPPDRRRPRAAGRRHPRGPGRSRARRPPRRRRPAPWPASTSPWTATSTATSTSTSRPWPTHRVRRGGPALTRRDARP